MNDVKQKAPKIKVDCLDLSNYDIEFFDGRPNEKYNEDTRMVISKVLEADFFLLGSPVFNGSIPAPLKNIFDLIPPTAFRHKIIGLVANGGTYQHHLMIENQLKPIIGYLRAFATPSYVYAQNSYFDSDNTIIDPDLLERVSNLADELLFMQYRLGDYSTEKQFKDVIEHSNFKKMQAVN